MSSGKTRLIFDHLPKTAGHSIAAALRGAFEESGALAAFSNRHWHSVASAGVRRLLVGHLWFAPGEALAEGWYYCTMLRDPIDRFLSQFAFNRSLAQVLAVESPRDERLADPQVVEAVRCSLEEYLALESADIKSSYTNVQAVHFAQRMCSFPRELSESALLEAASEALDDYDLVGTFDELQGFVDTACLDCGLAAQPLPALNVNVSRGRPEEVPQHVIGHLRAVNRIDLRLFDLARQRFAARRRVPVRGAAPPSSPTAIGFGTREIEILSAWCAGESSGSDSILSGERVRLHLDCVARIVEDDLTLGIAVRGRSGELVYGTNSKMLGRRLAIGTPGGFKVSLDFHANLAIGEYLLTVALHRGVEHVAGCYHWLDWAARFAVVGYGRGAFQGPVDLGFAIHDFPDHRRNDTSEIAAAESR